MTSQSHSRESRIPASGPDADDLIGLAERTITSPIGPLLLIASPQGLRRIAFAGELGDEAIVEERAAAREAGAAAESGRQLPAAAAHLDQAARELDEYFAGDRRDFSLTLDRRAGGGGNFRRAALEQLLTIAYGETASYGDIAAAAGSPRASRAVGTACATNPLPIVVPCHRVVHADGTIGQYGGSPEAKRFLLDLETAADHH